MLARLTAWRRRLGTVFLLTVALPTTVAILYFGGIASDVYVSESRFVVRSPEKQSASALGMLLKGAGFANAGEELHAVQDYILSRDALAQLNRGARVAKAYSAPGVDAFSSFDGFGLDGSFEALYKYFQSVVEVQNDATSSIVTLTVSAYTPQDARAFNAALLAQGEALVNRLNQRGQRDLVRYGEAQVVEAQDRSRRAASALARYRDRQGVLDPEKQAQVQVQLVAKLQDELIATRGQLSQLLALTPDNPQVESLRNRLGSLQREIARERGSVAGGSGSLAGKASAYQRLQLESQFADRQLGSAMASLEQAATDAQRQQAYVERIVQPNLPDVAIEPRRLRSVLATFLLGLAAWGILTMLLAGVREHQD